MTGIDETAEASAFGLDTEYKDMREGAAALCPQRLGLIGQGRSDKSYPLTKWTATSAAAAGERYGYGSPIHLSLLMLMPANGDGVGTIPVDVLPLEDAYEAVAAVGRITPTGTQTERSRVRVKVNKIAGAWFNVETDDNAGAIVDKIVSSCNGVLEMPALVTDGATYAIFTAKWAGSSGNDLLIEVEAEALGVTYAIIQPTGGSINPDVSGALALIGPSWVTQVLNCLDIADDDALDAYHEFAEGRWDPLVRKPLVFWTGNTEAVVATATAESSSRKTARGLGQLTGPGCGNLPFMVAARQLARILKVANSVPAKSYQKQKANGLSPGDDSVQWDYASRDQAVKAGSSTTEVVDGIIEIKDVVTFYRPTGEIPPGYQFAVNIVKLQNCIYNFSQEFEKEEWASAPLVKNEDVVTEPTARKPKDYEVKANQLLVSLGLRAIVADVKAAKKKTRARINSNNPNRLDLTVEFPLSSNGNILNMTQTFGFLAGG